MIVGVEEKPRLRSRAWQVQKQIPAVVPLGLGTEGNQICWVDGNFAPTSLGSRVCPWVGAPGGAVGPGTAPPPRPLHFSG